MKRLAVVLCVALVIGAQAVTHAQAKIDLTGTWRFNQAKSSPNIAGNTPTIPFPSQIVVTQTAASIAIDSTSVRQQPVSAVFSLDGSKVTVKAPSGISESGEAKFEGSTLVITSRRSFSSPAGETIVDFKEVWTLDGGVLTIVKTRIQDGESASETAVYDKM